MKNYIRTHFKKTTLLISFLCGTMLKHNKKKRPHWNWIADQIILGALPIKTKFFRWGGHDLKITTQAIQNLKPLGLVISAVQPYELEGKGLPIKPVSIQVWENLCVLHQHLNIADFSADVSYATVLKALEMMHSVLENKKTVYIHCKAGRGRSWMILMCYLTTFGGITFEIAQKLVREKRPHVAPSDEQIQFVKNFGKKYNSKN